MNEIQWFSYENLKIIKTSLFNFIEDIKMYRLVAYLAPPSSQYTTHLEKSLLVLNKTISSLNDQMFEKIEDAGKSDLS